MWWTPARAERGWRPGQVGRCPQPQKIRKPPLPPLENEGAAAQACLKISKSGSQNPQLPGWCCSMRWAVSLDLERLREHGHQSGGEIHRGGADLQRDGSNAPGCHNAVNASLAENPRPASRQLTATIRRMWPLRCAKASADLNSCAMRCARCSCLLGGLANSRLRLGQRCGSGSTDLQPHGLTAHSSSINTLHLVRHGSPRLCGGIRHCRHARLGRRGSRE